MLNQNQSKKWNLWKYSLVFPALVAFVFLFQIEVVAQEKEAKSIEKKLLKEQYTEILVTKNTTDEELKKYCKELKQTHDIDLSFFNIKRNQNGEIINIESESKDNTDNATCKTSENPIKPFKFYYDENKKEMGYNMSLTEEKEVLNSAKNTITKTPNNTLTQLDDKNNIQSTLKQDIDSRPLIIIDGIKKDSNFKIEDLDPNNIQSINVLKGHQATMQYNESGKNGVMEITTKEKAVINKFQSIQRKTFQGFQTKQNENKNTAIDKFDFIVKKNTTDEEIKEKCEQIKNLHNIDLTFFNIKRNNNGEIINIESKYKNNANGNNGYFTTIKKPIGPFKFYSEKKDTGEHTIGYATLSNSISRIIENKTIDYKKAVILIDGKQSDYQDLEKVNPKEVKRVITKDIKPSSEENKKYVELYGEKALYGFLIEIQTK